MTRCFPVFAGLLLAQVPPNLEDHLRSRYVWTAVDGRTGDVITPGSILVVRKDGISTNPANAPFSAQNIYKDGELKRSVLNIFTQNQATAGSFLTGDRVYVTRTEVKDNNVVLSLLSADVFESVRNKASVSFQFPQGFLDSAAFVQVAAVIDEVLSIESAAIELGAPTNQVLAILGQPPKIADLGRKQIFFYPDLKVTFLDGKVSGVR